MARTPRATASELVHQRALLRTHTRNLQALERQIAALGPDLAPAHLLARRDWHAAERARALRRVHGLERQRAAPSSPAVAAHVLDAPIPTGVLHLLDPADFPLVTVELANPTREPAVFTVASWLEERSFTRADRVTLPTGGTATVRQLPTLKPGALAASYEVGRGALHVRVSQLRRGGETLLLHQSQVVCLLARDVLVWGTRQPDGRVSDHSALLGAWVTPNERAVVALLGRAAARAPGGRFVGYQGGGSPGERAAIARGQARAIFEALQADAGIVYVNAPLSMGPAGEQIRQRVSLPRDSLAYGQANCVDGAVLYASLLERAALSPAIVLVPGHAFVGWETWAGSGSFEFLETTMTAGHPFEAALWRGQEQFAAARHLLGRPLFDRGGFARLLPLVALRAAGVVPLE